jgi:hypothetical protein
MLWCKQKQYEHKGSHGGVKMEWVRNLVGRAVISDIPFSCLRNGIPM